MWNRGWGERKEIPLPAAGANQSYRIPGETYEAILAARMTLTTSAAAANRHPLLAVLDGDSAPILRVASSSAVVASTARSVSFVHDFGASLFSPSGDDVLPFSAILFPPGFQVLFAVDAIQGADQLSDLSLYLWRIPSGEWEPSTGAIPYSP